MREKKEIISNYTETRASQIVLVVKNIPANARDIRGASSIPHGNPL